MIEGSGYFLKISEKIDSLISKNDFNKAYEYYKTLIDKYPYEKATLKIKKKIDYNFQKLKDKQLKELLKEIYALEKNENYKEALEKMQKVLNYFQNRKLNKIYKKLQNKYQKQVLEEESKFRNSINSFIKEALNKNTLSFLNDLNKLEVAHPANSLVKKLIKETKDKYILQNIEKNKEIFKSNNYNLQEKIIKDLKQVNTSFKALSEIEKQYKKNRYLNQILEKSESKYKGSSEITTLYKLKKYNQVIKAIKQLIKADMADKESLKLLKKSEIKMATQTRNETLKQIQKEQPELKAALKKNPKKFIKI